MKIVQRAINKIIPYEDNPRIVPERAIQAVMRSIEKFGFRQPIVVDEKGVVIVGHARLFAANRLKLKNVPVHVATGLTPSQTKAYRIADNKTQELTSWDNEKLIDELTELKEGLSEVEALEVPGFSDIELDRMLQIPKDSPRKLRDPTDPPATGKEAGATSTKTPSADDPPDTPGRGRGTDASQVPEDAKPENVRLVACPRCFHRFQIEIRPAWEREEDQAKQDEESGKEED